MGTQGRGRSSLEESGPDFKTLAAPQIFDQQLLGFLSLTAASMACELPSYFAISLYLGLALSEKLARFRILPLRAGGNCYRARKRIGSCCLRCVDVMFGVE